MRPSTSIRKSITLGLVGLTLAACGGGGGGGGSSTTPPSAPTLTFTPEAIKTFDFTWADVSGATEYRLLENPDGVSGFTQIATLPADATKDDINVSLPARINARYMLEACDSAGCTDSNSVSVSDTLTEAVGYMKASNTDVGDGFGFAVALAGDGNTLAVGAIGEDSNAVNGNQLDNSAPSSGAVYVFTRSGSTWSEQAYIKASNTDAYDDFGSAVAVAADGNTLAVGAPFESSNATDINGDQLDNSASGSGAVYVFTRSGSTWNQDAYLKASNTGAGDEFGRTVALAGDGNTLAVGAPFESSSATGINGNQTDNSAERSGAVYVFIRSVVTQTPVTVVTGALPTMFATSWSQQAYIKASNAGAGDNFGWAVALTGDGNTLAVGALGEESNATGIDGDQTDNSAPSSGAVYTFTRSTGTWSQQDYVKASNTNTGNTFGSAVALAGDGNTLVVGAPYEDSNSGAAYVFARIATNSGSTWRQQAYVRASNTGAGDHFGTAVALAGDGNTLAVGAHLEDSSATGVNGDQTDNSAPDSGAVYVFSRSGSAWGQEAYVKASNTGAGDYFGSAVALAGDGNTLAVGATDEDSNATSIDDNSAPASGAAYLF